MIALVEGAERQKTPNEIALNILLAGPDDRLPARRRSRCSRSPIYSGRRAVGHRAGRAARLPDPDDDRRRCSRRSASPGMDRLVQRNVLAMSGRAVEAAGDCSTLLLDKTGTITLGNRQATEFIPLPGVDERELADAAQLSSLADETPEGRSIVVLAEGALRPARARASPARDARAVHRPDPDERRRPQRAQHPQGRGRLRCAAGSTSRAAPSRAELDGDRRRDRRSGRHAARRRRERRRGARRRST